MKAIQAVKHPYEMTRDEYVKDAKDKWLKIAETEPNAMRSGLALEVRKLNIGEEIRFGDIVVVAGKPDTLEKEAEGNIVTNNHRSIYRHHAKDHEQQVKQALSEGKSVPTEVLKDYPGFMIHIAYEEIESLLPESVELVGVEHDSNFDECYTQIAECIEAGSTQCLHDLIDIAGTWEEEVASIAYVTEDLKKDMINKYHMNEAIANKILKKYADRIEETLRSRDTSDIVGEMLKNTKDIPIRISLYSNYEAMESAWAMGQGSYAYEGYYKDAVDALNLNPAKLKRSLLGQGHDVSGRFPDKRDRDGLEYVTYEEFVTEVDNTASGSNKLVLIGLMNGEDVIRIAEGMIVTVPKGNYAGMFDGTAGGGSILEMRLQRDMTIKLGRIPRKTEYDSWGLRIDGNAKNAEEYTLAEVYGGLGDVLLGKHIKVTAPKLREKKKEKK